MVYIGYANMSVLSGPGLHVGQNGSAFSSVSNFTLVLRGFLLKIIICAIVPMTPSPNIT